MAVAWLLFIDPVALGVVLQGTFRTGGRGHLFAPVDGSTGLDHTAVPDGCQTE